VINVLVNGTAQVSLGIARVGAVVTDLSKRPGGMPSLWERWRDAFFTSERELFDSEGGAGASGSWPQLSPAYAAWKAKHYPGGKILVASGAMKAALTSAGGGGVFETTATHMFIGTERIAGYHWPRRKAIDISSVQEREYFGRALAAWGVDVSREWGGK
jgi:hypothetical protein